MKKILLLITFFILFQSSCMPSRDRFVLSHLKQKYNESFKIIKKNVERHYTGNILEQTIKQLTNAKTDNHTYYYYVSPSANRNIVFMAYFYSSKYSSGSELINDNYYIKTIEYQIQRYASSIMPTGLITLDNMECNVSFGYGGNNDGSEQIYEKRWFNIEQIILLESKKKYSYFDFNLIINLNLFFENKKEYGPSMYLLYKTFMESNWKNFFSITFISSLKKPKKLDISKYYPKEITSEEDFYKFITDISNWYNSRF